jgi:hypothetical protein
MNVCSWATKLCHFSSFYAFFLLKNIFIYFYHCFFFYYTNFMLPFPISFHVYILLLLWLWKNPLWIYNFFSVQVMIFPPQSFFFETYNAVFCFVCLVYSPLLLHIWCMFSDISAFFWLLGDDDDDDDDGSKDVLTTTSGSTRHISQSISDCSKVVFRHSKIAIFYLSNENLCLNYTEFSWMSFFAFFDLIFFCIVQSHFFLFIDTQKHGILII